MPAPRFIVVEASATGRQALEQAGDAVYIIIHLADGGYAVIKPPDLRAKLSMWRTLDKPLADLPAKALAPQHVAALSEDDPTLEARCQALRADEALVVTAASGEFRELVVGGKTFRGGTPKMAKPPETMEVGSKGPGTLKDETESSTAPAPEKRYINVEMKDSDEKPLDPKSQPLKKDLAYSLIFDVDIEARQNSILDKPAEFSYKFQDGEQKVKITVKLESSDFEFLGAQEQPLTVPRSGKSLNKASFSVQPLHDGECQINAIFLKDGNFIQVIVLKFFVGEIFQAQTLGRDVNAAFAVQPRDVSLTILNSGAAFQVILTSGVAATATLPIKLPELKDIVNQARNKLLELVHLEEDGQVFYQRSVDIPEPVNQYALQQLAEAGFRLYQRIFFGPSADEQARNMGRVLRQLAQKEKLKIQIFSQDFVLPWGLLYMADSFDPNNIKPELFLGLRHIIEHIPLQQNLKAADNRMDGRGDLAVSLNVNTDIDQQTHSTLIGSQVEYWQKLKGNGARVSLITRTTAPEVTGALANPQTADQVLYFYCHGDSKDVDEKGGVSASALVLSNHGRITLDDLNLYASTDCSLPNAPLVFINACESAQLSPLVYDGFVPYFMAKGARGVIGTEVEIPALFAVEWAERFFERFLRGEAVGEIFLALRKEFFEQHHNLMGLLYALYVDGDTRLEPGVLA